MQMHPYLETTKKANNSALIRLIRVIRKNKLLILYSVVDIGDPDDAEAVGTNPAAKTPKTQLISHTGDNICQSRI
jgi:hypothetical protein